MNLLIPHGRPSDEYLVKYAREQGHTVHLMSKLMGEEKLKEARDVCRPDYFVPMKTRYEMQMDHESYREWYHDQLASYVAEHQIDAILPSTSVETVMREVAMVNDLYDLPGIRGDQAMFFYDKSVYLPGFARAGVRVPEIYEIVEPGDEPTNYDLPYPVIAKPGLGSGGYGVFVAKNDYELRWFFSASDRPKNFTQESLFYQDKGTDGQPKCYVHFGFGGRYIVQEYVSGPCVSLVGTAWGGNLELNLAYDIGITPPPYCTETSFSWPSAHPGAQEAAELLTTNLRDAVPYGLGFPDGAWMADTIYRNGELWLVDFSPRPSNTGSKMMMHTCQNPSYVANVLSCALYGDRDYYTKPRVATTYCFIPFPKGVMQSVEYPDADAIRGPHGARVVEVNTPVQSGTRITEMRNDVQASERGWIVVESEEGTREHTDGVAAIYLDSIQYEVHG